MWYLRDFMNACVRQIIFQAVIIFLIGFLVGCQTPYTDNFLGQGVSVDDIVDDLDQYAAPGHCVTDGFDWICRGELHVITLEVIKEVEIEVIREVEVEVEVIKEVAKPITIRELYAVIVKPNEIIETPVGIIQTDVTGTVVSVPEDVTVTSVTVQDDGTITPQTIHTPEGIGDRDSTPQGDGIAIPQATGVYIVWTQIVNGRKQSGVIHSDYVVIDQTAKTITFTGADGEVDPSDSVKEFLKVETGYSYEQASKRAAEILSE